jgi:peptidoglycan/LPS O-acetylase OafA/YrhL
MTAASTARANFRSDINGLRAWAVVAVILYHFGVPGFNGGFVGVDSFFVISGFLMTGIVVKGLERGDFSIIRFYTARARRIVPALLGLCAVLLALGWFVLLPPDYKLLGSHSVYAVSFLSNIEFWQEAGYFDVSSHEKWLLHTWSLSVEWQFYLILPLVLWAAWRIKPGRTAQTWTVAIALAASLAASIVVTSTQPSAAFYLLHTRAWEMLGGGMIFLLAGKLTLSARQQRLIEATGFFLMSLAIAQFDKDTPWPGCWAMVPVGATMLVLLANRRSLWTGHGVAQWLGNRSYSLYLWHWPVVVALVYVDLQANALAITMGVILTALLGHGSYVWIESTSRRWLERRRVAISVGGLALAAVTVMLPALLVWKQQGVMGRFAPAIELAAAEASNGNPRNEECSVSKGLAMPSCVFGGLDWKVIVLGDSHAAALVTGVAKAQSKGDAGVVQWTYSGCPFVPGMKKTPAELRAVADKGSKCSEFMDWAQASLKTLPPSVPVVIINRYAAYAFGRNEDRHLVEVPLMYSSKVYRTSTPEFIAEFASHVTRSACEIAAQRPVYMVRPIPEMGFHVPKTLSRRMAFGSNDNMSISMEAYQKRNAWVWAAQDAARDLCGVKLLDPTPYLCRNGRCYVSQNGRPLYTDDNHLSEFGNTLLLPMFAEVFQNL